MKFDFGNNKYRHDSIIHEPYLVQRCKTSDFNSHMKASEYLKLDYMGSSEFEWGALPEWLREMNSKLNRLIITPFEYNGLALAVACEKQHIESYTQTIRYLVDGKIRTKEGARLHQKEIVYVGKNRKPMFDQPHAPFEFDCWWDITNGLAFSRKGDVLHKLMITIPNSIRFMNEQKRKNG